MAATYFGEVTDLDSRAVWYSDEEDADEDNLLDSESCSTLIETPVSHETFRTSLTLNFERFTPNPIISIKDCIISLVSTAKFRGFKASDSSPLLGQYKDLCKVFLCPTSTQSVTGPSQGEALLWLMFDQNAPWITGTEVSYLVEALRDQLYTELGFNPSSPVIILTKQFSNSEHLEYLSNYTISDPKLALPFSGRPILPPALVKNSFESSLFEQLTLTLKLAYVVCLPDPRNYWFDKTLYWPTIPNQIIEQRLNDDNLEKTLIFT